MNQLRKFFIGVEAEAGQALILLAILLLAMLILVGLAIDAGQANSARRPLPESTGAAAPTAPVPPQRGRLGPNCAGPSPCTPLSDRCRNCPQRVPARSY